MMVVIRGRKGFPMRSLLPVLGALLLSAASLAQTSTPPAYEADPMFQDAMKEGKRLEAQQPQFAPDAFKKANKIAGGSCLRCLEALYKAQMHVADYKGAIGTAKQMQTLAATPMEKSVADMHLGVALYQQGGDKPKPAQLEAAHAAFQSAVVAYPKNMGARYTDGCVLAKLGKLDEAKEDFSACAAAASPRDPMRMRAQHFAENPALALNHMAPPIVVNSVDGTKFNLDDMGGRVVLVDFWATWCGPCNEELPHLQRLVKEFKDQPLTVISISWDSNEDKWRSFIKQHDMTWVQYRDADQSLTKQFGVPSIPHYFLIDSDGVLYPQMLGADSDVEGKIKKFLTRAAKEKASSQQVASAGN